MAPPSNPCVCRFVSYRMRDLGAIPSIPPPDNQLLSGNYCASAGASCSACCAIVSLALSGVGFQGVLNFHLAPLCFLNRADTDLGLIFHKVWGIESGVRLRCHDNRHSPALGRFVIIFSVALQQRTR